MYRKERSSGSVLGMTIKPDPFYDRKLELAALDRAWKRHGAGGQMLLLYGRKRLGKTFLLQRYFSAGLDGDEHEKPHCYFLAEQSTAATQRLMLARQLIAALPSEGISAEDIAVSWNALLRYADPESSHRSIRRHNITQIVIDRIEGNRHRRKFLDMCLDFRCFEGCVVVLFGLPLSIVNHAFVVPAHVQGHRDEPLLRSEGLLG